MGQGKAARVEQRMTKEVLAVGIDVNKAVLNTAHTPRASTGRHATISDDVGNLVTHRRKLCEVLVSVMRC
jgi:hypothetical protein